MEQQTIIDKDFMSVILSVSQNINVKWSYKKNRFIKMWHKPSRAY